VLALVVRHDLAGAEPRRLPECEALVRRGRRAPSPSSAVRPVGKEWTSFAQPMSDADKKQLFNLRDEDFKKPVTGG